MQHLDEGTVHAWLDGALSPADAAEVEQHVARCDACAAMVAEARGMIAGAARIVGALDVVPGGVIPRRSTGARGSGSLWRTLRLTPFRAALAASLMIAAASLAVARRGDDSVARRSVNAASPSAQSTAPSAAPAPAPTALVPATPSAPPAAAGASAPAVEASKSAVQAPERRVANEPARDVGRITGAAMPDSTRMAKAATPPPVIVTSTAAAAPADLVARTGSVAPMTADSIAADSRSLQSALLDSAAARAARSSLAAMREVTTDRQLNAIGAQRLVASPEARSSDFIGCYRVGSENGAQRQSLPERFALAQTSTMPTRSLVLPVDSAGRPDSGIVGTWRPVTKNSVLVNLTTAPRQPMMLTFATAGYSSDAAASSGASSGAVRVFRADCRR